MPKNIYYIIITITLGSITKIKRDKVTFQTVLFTPALQENGLHTVMGPQFWLAAYIVPFLDCYF